MTEPEALDCRYEETPCDLCGSDGAEPHVSVPGRTKETFGSLFRIVKCRDCGLVYMNPRPAREELIRFYPQEDYLSPVEPGPGARREMAARARKDRPLVFRGISELTRGRKGRALDIGCGGGEVLAALAEEGWAVGGVEPMARAAERASAALGVPIVNRGIEDVEIEKATWDLAVLSQALEHVTSPAGLLKKIRPGLREGGLLYVGVPNAGSLQAGWFGANWFNYDCPRHLYYFTERTLEAVLRNAGFRVEKMESDGGVTASEIQLSLLCGMRPTGRSGDKPGSARRFLDRQRRTACKLAGKAGAPFLNALGSGAVLNAYCRPG